MDAPQRTAGDGGARLFANGDLLLTNSRLRAMLRVAFEDGWASARADPSALGVPAAWGAYLRKIRARSAPRCAACGTEDHATTTAE